MSTAKTTILFQGDSITDAGRERSDGEPNQAPGLGRGYAFLCACRLLSNAPGTGLRVYNRGVSGHRVPDLLERWQRDAIALAPDVLSILIGVNDIWHKLDGRYHGTVVDYEKGYDELLSSTRRALPQVRLVLCEPFALRCGAVHDGWFPEMDERRAVAARLAQRHGAAFVAFQSTFDEAIAKGTPPEYWAPDGVHPSPAGHQLMADAWLGAARLD